MPHLKDTKLKGDINENYCATEFLKLGFQCLYPRGERARYDFVAEKENRYLRIQCKCSYYCKTDKSIFTIRCYSSHRKGGKNVTNTYNANQVELLATYINSTLYLIPVKDLPKSGTINIRIKTPPKESLIKYRPAEDYNAHKVLVDLGFTITQTNPSESLLSEDTVVPSKRSHRCPHCGTPVYKKGQCCKKCSLERRRILFIKRDILKNLLRTTPCTIIGKQYKVSDTAVRKLCKIYNLPHNIYKIRKMTDEEWNAI